MEFSFDTSYSLYLRRGLQANEHGGGSRSPHYDSIRTGQLVEQERECHRRFMAFLRVRKRPLALRSIRFLRPDAVAIIG
jgi:hypothetical protein